MAGLTAESSGLAEVKDDKVSSAAIVKETTVELESYEKPWFESETALKAVHCIVPLYFLAVIIYMHSDYIYPKMSLFINNHPWTVIPAFFGLLIFLFLLQLMVTCIFICLEIFCNTSTLTLALMNIPAIISRIAAHIAAKIHPDPLCHSLLFLAYNGVLFYVGFRKPVYSYVGGISVIIGVFFFYMGPSYYYEILLLVYILYNAIFKFSFMKFSEQHYARNYRSIHGGVMLCCMLLLLIIHWRKPLEVWEMIPKENLKGKGRWW